MSKNTRKRTQINYAESTNSEESSYSDNEEFKESSDEEQVPSEVDDSDRNSELCSEDFDSEEDLSDSMFYSDSSSVKWSKMPPDLSELSIIPKGRLYPGLLFPVLHCRSIIDIFKYFIDETMLQHIINCTNNLYEENVTMEELM